MLVLLHGEIADQGDETLRAVGRAHVRDELAVHDESRYAIDAVALAFSMSAFCMAASTENEWYAFVNASSGIPEFFRELGLKSLRSGFIGIGGDQRVSVDVNFLEDLGVQLIELAETLERIEETRQRSGCPGST